MLYATFQNNTTSDLEKMLKVFTIYSFVATSYEGSKCILALTGQAVLEKMFENNGHTCISCI